MKTFKYYTLSGISRENEKGDIARENIFSDYDRESVVYEKDISGNEYKALRITSECHGINTYQANTLRRPKYRLQYLADSLMDDMRAIFKAYGIEPLTMSAMYAALSIVSTNRAYNDQHPTFADGYQKRILPFDGRDYCFYYRHGANDDHVRTLLKNILIAFKNEAKT